MKKYDLIRNTCILGIISIWLIYTANNQNKFVDIGNNIYACEFALCDDEIKLIRPIGSKNYYDIINNNCFFKENVQIIPKANLVDFLTEEQINNIINYKISKEELIEVFDYVYNIYGDEWLSIDVNLNHQPKVKTLKKDNF